jgi:hypothetical protein
VIVYIEKDCSEKNCSEKNYMNAFLEQDVFIYGMIEVSPMGRTQIEKRYILETVLEHLPKIKMKVNIIQRDGYTCSCNCDEFGINLEKKNLEKKSLKNRKNCSLIKLQDNYFLIIEGKTNMKQLQKWLCRLSKRVIIINVMININNIIIQNTNEVYTKMFEEPSWCSDDNNWCEYLMWDRSDNSDYPIKLEYKLRS